MLSENNIRRINNQIEKKLRELDRPFTSSEDKEEIRKDLIVLNDLLKIHEEPEEPKPAPDSLIDEICSLLRNRHR